MKSKQAGFTLFELIFALGFLSLALTALFVAGHFIVKFW